MVTHTWSDHRDYEGLCEAYKMMDGVAEYVEASMRTSDALNKVLSIQNALGGEIQVHPLFQ